jgi:hypothetical protein
MSFSLYDKEELEAIAKKEESNNRMEEFFNSKREIWNKEIEPLNEISRLRYNQENASQIVELQASALAFRQRINEEVSFYLQKLSKEKIKLKRAVQEKMVWYAAGKSPLNLNGKLSNSQMTSIIDAHTSETERGVELIEIHIDFLRTSAKNLADIGYQVKNTIELYNLLSKN